MWINVRSSTVCLLFAYLSSFLGTKSINSSKLSVRARSHRHHTRIEWQETEMKETHSHTRQTTLRIMELRIDEIANHAYAHNANEYEGIKISWPHDCDDVYGFSIFHLHGDGDVD